MHCWYIREVDHSAKVVCMWFAPSPVTPYLVIMLEDHTWQLRVWLGRMAAQAGGYLPYIHTGTLNRPPVYQSLISRTRVHCLSIPHSLEYSGWILMLSRNKWQISGNTKERIHSQLLPVLELCCLDGTRSVLVTMVSSQPADIVVGSDRRRLHNGLNWTNLGWHACFNCNRTWAFTALNDWTWDTESGWRKDNSTCDAHSAIFGGEDASRVNKKDSNKINTKSYMQAQWEREPVHSVSLCFCSSSLYHRPLEKNKKPLIPSYLCMIEKEKWQVKNLLPKTTTRHFTLLSLRNPSNRSYSCPNPTVSSTAHRSLALSASYVLYGGRSSLLKQVCDLGNWPSSPDFSIVKRRGPSLPCKSLKPLTGIREVPVANCNRRDFCSESQVRIVCGGELACVRRGYNVW